MATSGCITILSRLKTDHKKMHSILPCSFPLPYIYTSAEWPSWTLATYELDEHNSSTPAHFLDMGGHNLGFFGQPASYAFVPFGRHPLQNAQFTISLKWPCTIDQYLARASTNGCPRWQNRIRTIVTTQTKDQPEANNHKPCK